MSSYLVGFGELVGLFAALVVLGLVVRAIENIYKKTLTPQQLAVYEARKQSRQEHRDYVKREAARLNAAEDRRAEIARERRRQRGPWWW